MHKRNGTSYALGLRLWEIYIRRLLAETRANERFIVHYQAFFEEPEAELKKVATFAGWMARGPPRPPPSSRWTAAIRLSRPSK